MTTPAVPWRPTPEQVHALLARREPFTASSRPSLAEVESLIDRVVAEVAVEVVGDLPTNLHEFARTTVAYGAASLVEQAFTPEQSLGDEAPAAALYERYTALLARLRSFLAGLGIATAPSGDAGGRVYKLGTSRTPTAYELAVLAAETV